MIVQNREVKSEAKGRDGYVAAISNFLNWLKNIMVWLCNMQKEEEILNVVLE